ncbi:uncharacterized protein LOC6554465 [Drosophila erecta]|uniref:GG11996 n=1 Tax=Drosophila erecta TaxID=7220 RepID=B3P5C1_DROER|nr:uncharacterized protein LOC6554465 [Drosophila erecta]EDV53171.1 uncharacterized protein Dere_GG11996 [Drosophila erecta]
MASKKAVYTAGFIHLVLGLSVCLWPPKDTCSPAPNLGAWIFAGALLLLASDVKMYPDRYTHLPYAIQFLVETVGSLAILEFFTYVVWCTLERLIHHLTRLLLLYLGMNDDTYLALEYWILLIPTTVVASTLLYIMKMVIIPYFDITSVYAKQQVKVHLNKNVYIDVVSQNLHKRRKYI